MIKNVEFKNYNLTITLTPFINIIGTPASGKTKLLKNLINQLHGANIYLDDKPINSYDIDFLRKNVSAVLNNVKEELLYYQNMVNKAQDVAYQDIDNFVKFFSLDDIIESKIRYLTTYEKAFVKILSLLIINPSILGIDDMLTYLKVEDKIKIIKYAKENNISILNITTNPEELLFGTDIIILDNEHVLAYDKSENILGNNQYLAKIGMSEPFIVELCTNLNYYDLLKDKYFNMKDLIGELWK
jgi:ABC-type cobalamin/Fe3+-siderophores transport system ATPase subunit